MNELLQNLKNADRICEAANEHYVKAGALEQQISEMNASLKKQKKKWILIGVAIYFGVGIVQSFLNDIQFLVTLVGFVGIIGAIFIGVMGYKRAKANINEQIADMQTQISAEHSAAQQIFDNNVETLAFLPVDYWYPLATNYLVQVIQSGRATTLPEALDKFEEQLHRWKIEEANAQMVNMQQQQTAYLSSIKTSSKVSAIANVTNTVFNIASKM